MPGDIRGILHFLGEGYTGGASDGGVGFSLSPSHFSLEASLLLNLCTERKF